MFENFQTESAFKIGSESVIMVHLSTNFHVPISATYRLSVWNGQFKNIYISQ